MTVHLRLVSESERLVRLVGEFAQGLGCTLEAAPPGSGELRAEVPGAEALLELLSYVALSATKLGVQVLESLCEVTYRHDTAASDVTLGLRIVDIRLHGPAVAAG